MPRSIDGHAVTVIVIDDRSTDSTVDQVSACQAAIERANPDHLHLIRQAQNGGKGAALKRALAEVRGDSSDALVWMDGDGQHLVSSLPSLVEPVLTGRLDLCVGSRYLDLDQPATAPLNRRLVRRVAARSVSSTTGFTVTDPFSGLRCFSPAALDALELEGDRYEAELESCLSIARGGLRYGEVSIPRIYGPETSKMGYHRGALRGRLGVIAGYIQTIHSARKRVREPQGTPTNG